jgi:hypothetical protein
VQFPYLDISADGDAVAEVIKYEPPPPGEEGPDAGERA